jgi:hypothetical protein
MKLSFLNPSKTADNPVDRAPRFVFAKALRPATRCRPRLDLAHDADAQLGRNIFFFEAGAGQKTRDRLDLALPYRALRQQRLELGAILDRELAVLAQPEKPFESIVHRVLVYLLFTNYRDAGIKLVRT